MQALTGIYDGEKEEWILPPMFYILGDENESIYLLFPSLSDNYDYYLDEEEKGENQKALEEIWGKLDKAIFLVNKEKGAVISLDKSVGNLSSDTDFWTIDYKNKVIFHWNTDERNCLMNFEGKSVLEDSFLEYQAYPSFFVGYLRDESDDDSFNIYRYNGEIIYENVEGYPWKQGSGYYVFEVKTGGVSDTSNILFREDEYIGMYDGVYHFEKDFVFVEDEGKHHVIDVKTKKSIYVSDYGIESFSIDRSDFPIEKMTVKHSRIDGI